MTDEQQAVIDAAKNWVDKREPTSTVHHSELRLCEAVTLLQAAEADKQP